MTLPRGRGITQNRKTMATKTALANLFLLLHALPDVSLASSAVTPALSFTRDEGTRDLTLGSMFEGEGSTKEVVDMTWCVRFSFESLHHQPVFIGDNSAFNIEEVRMVAMQFSDKYTGFRSIFFLL